jgi:sulfur carrier protein ThiS
MNQKKYFFFNGQKYYTKGNLKISDLLTYFNFPVSNSTFILEYNKFIYPELA